MCPLVFQDFKQNCHVLTKISRLPDIRLHENQFSDSLVVIWEETDITQIEIQTDRDTDRYSEANRRIFVNLNCQLA
jgi:hypothetical protein